MKTTSAAKTRSARPLRALAAVTSGLALAVCLAGPASASTGDPSDSPALKAWLGDTSVQETPVAGDAIQSAAASTLAASATAQTASSTPTKGERLTHKHGGPLLWTENILEWYWNSSKITSSNGSQADGYVFPNTASKGGIKRTLVTNGQHNWRGSMVAGIGIVTPWGAVNVTRTTITDNYELIRGGKDYINP